MPFRGDFAELQRLVKTVASTSGRVIPAATRAAGGEVTVQYLSDFSGSHDPWGGRWATPQAGGKPLFKSGALAGARVAVSRDAVKILPPPYWVFHQVGANNMARRGVLPFGPSDWDPPTFDAIHVVVMSHFR